MAYQEYDEALCAMVAVCVGQNPDIPRGAIARSFGIPEADVHGIVETYYREKRARGEVCARCTIVLAPGEGPIVCGDCYQKLVEGRLSYSEGEFGLSLTLQIVSRRSWMESAIRRRREALDLSQAELGELLGVHYSTISLWERGLNPMSDTTVLDICAILDAMREGQDIPNLRAPVYQGVKRATVEKFPLIRDAIRQYVEAHHTGPSLQDIRAAVGFDPRRTITIMKRLGLITQHMSAKGHPQKRAYWLVEQKEATDDFPGE